MWFLGKPEKIKLTLSFVNTGPVELDFQTLELDEQKQILIDLQNGVIQTDANLEELHQTWLIRQQPPEPKALVIEPTTTTKPKAKPTLSVSQKTLEKCRFLSKKSVNGIKIAISKETDTKLLKALLMMEEQKQKPRHSVCDLLKGRILAIQEEVQENIRQSTTKVIPTTKKTLEDTMTVEETDEEVVTFALRS